MGSTCAGSSVSESEATSGYELFYWPVTALGEPIRIALTIGKIPFKDNTPKNCPEFMAKKDASGCQVPFLTFDGMTMGQSKAILRYLGKEITYDGEPLYPKDSMKAYKCDELIDLIEDMRSPIAPTFAIKDQAEKEAARAALFAPDGKITKFLEKLEKRLDTFGPNVTIGDIYAFCIINMMRQPTFIDGIPAGAIDKYTNLNKHHNFVATLPPVAEYYKSAEGIRVTFKPLN